VTILRNAKNTQKTAYLHRKNGIFPRVLAKTPACTNPHPWFQNLATIQSLQNKSTDRTDFNAFQKTLQKVVAAMPTNKME
jgi:hypothetical protein